MPLRHNLRNAAPRLYILRLAFPEAQGDDRMRIAQPAALAAIRTRHE